MNDVNDDSNLSDSKSIKTSKIFEVRYETMMADIFNVNGEFIRKILLKNLFDESRTKQKKTFFIKKRTFHVSFQCNLR